MPCRTPPTHVRMRFNPPGIFFPDKIADSGWVFAQHFCNRLGASYLALKNVLNEANPAHEEVLMDIKRRFRDETFTRESIANVIHAHPELVRKRILSHIPFGMLTFKADPHALRELCNGAIPDRRGAATHVRASSQLVSTDSAN
jgi:hypothetical protein